LLWPGGFCYFRYFNHSTLEHGSLLFSLSSCARLTHDCTPIWQNWVWCIQEKTKLWLCRPMDSRSVT
jgi:hypothetical protein